MRTASKSQDDEFFFGRTPVTSTMGLLFSAGTAAAIVWKYQFHWAAILLATLMCATVATIPAVINRLSGSNGNRRREQERGEVESTKMGYNNMTTTRAQTTMTKVAVQAGEPPTEEPKTACTIAAAFIRGAEETMGREERHGMDDLVPLLVKTARPRAAAARASFLRDRAATKYAPEAMYAAGKRTMARILRDEPDPARTAMLAGELASLMSKEPSERVPEQRKERRAWARHTCNDAQSATETAKGNGATADSESARQAGHAAGHWARATGKRLPNELKVTIEELLNIR